MSNGYLSDLLNGKATPSIELIVKIREYTKGEVTAESFMPPLKVS